MVDKYNHNFKVPVHNLELEIGQKQALYIPKWNSSY